MNIAIIGGGPSGLTAAFLLSKLNHNVTIFERAEEIGGLWASKMDSQGFFDSENSCKVYQSSYITSPALFELIGTKWQNHFILRHDLKKDWLLPFVADSTFNDRKKLLTAFALHISHIKSYKKESVYEFLTKHYFSEPFQSWMKATALGGITGTMNMTMWELFHRFQFNLSSLFFGSSAQLYWNAEPPNSPGGFITKWREGLHQQKVQIITNCEVNAMSKSDNGTEHQIMLNTSEGSQDKIDAVFVAIPPKAMLQLLIKSDPAISLGWGRPPEQLWDVLNESMYEHLGISWSFDRTFKKDLPLGGNGVRCNWHPILVQFSQYDNYLRPPAKTVVVGSVSLNTEFRHNRLGTLAKDYKPQELARIIWSDEKLADPTLPDPISVNIYGLSSATQIVKHGSLPVKNKYLPIYLATSLNGKSPYFTASLESAIQAGNAAAYAFDNRVIRLPC